MPKRTETSEAQPTPEVKKSPEATKRPEPVVETKHSLAITFSEEELRSKANDQLIAMLACYGIDPKDHEGKNTTVKLVKLFLLAQQDCLKKGDNPPTGLESFKESHLSEALIQQAAKPQVTYSLSFTKNMENYESLKVMAEVTLPVNPTEQEITDARNTMSIARELVETQLLNDLPDLAATFKP